MDELANKCKDEEITTKLNGIFHYENIDQCDILFPPQYLHDKKMSLEENPSDLGQREHWNNFIDWHDNNIKTNWEIADYINARIFELKDPSNSEIIDRTSYDKWKQSKMTKEQVQYIKNILLQMEIERNKRYLNLQTKSAKLRALFQNYKIAWQEVASYLDALRRILETGADSHESVVLEEDNMYKITSDFLNTKILDFTTIMDDLNESYDNWENAMKSVDYYRTGCIKFLMKPIDTLGPRERSRSLISTAPRHSGQKLKPSYSSVHLPSSAWKQEPLPINRGPTGPRTSRSRASSSAQSPPPLQGKSPGKPQLIPWPNIGSTEQRTSRSRGSSLTQSLLSGLTRSFSRSSSRELPTRSTSHSVVESSTDNVPTPPESQTQHEITNGKEPATLSPTKPPTKRGWWRRKGKGSKKNCVSADQSTVKHQPEKDTEISTVGSKRSGLTRKGFLKSVKYICREKLGINLDMCLDS